MPSAPRLSSSPRQRRPRPLLLRGCFASSCLSFPLGAWTGASLDAESARDSLEALSHLGMRPAIRAPQRPAAQLAHGLPQVAPLGCSCVFALYRLAQLHHGSALGFVQEPVESLQRLALFCEVVMAIVVSGLHAGDAVGLQTASYL